MGRLDIVNRNYDFAVNLKLFVKKESRSGQKKGRHFWMAPLSSQGAFMFGAPKGAL